MAAIRTDGLTKRFGDVVAVDGLDLTVEEGEVFGFLGPNGAGKSTTINVLLGFIEPSSGLDPKGIKLLRDIVHEEAARGATVFFSSHILDQVGRSATGSAS
jgi:ABC-type multidrug transport system ATPase subunit